MTGPSIPQPLILLSIAGTDPTSGAGISADLATFRDFGGYGTSVVTALVDQGTSALGSVLPTPEPFFARQLARLFAELPPRAVKIGLVPTPGLVMQLASALDALAPDTPRVLDPVLSNGRGEALVAPGTEEAIAAALLPRVTLITPNAPEAERLTGLAVADLDGALRAARALVARGARAALVKGGHLPGAPGDVLAWEGGETVLHNESGGGGDAARGGGVRPDVHGTGCHLASATAALLAYGTPLRAACEGARAYLSEAVQAAARPGPGARHVVLHGPATVAAATAALDASRTRTAGGAP